MGKRLFQELSSLKIKSLTKQKYYCDGGGLYFRIREFGVSHWVFRFTSRAGKAREMGLGPYPYVGLAEARERAAEARKTVRDGNDPLELRRDGENAAKFAEAKRITFAECAKQYIKAHRTGWKSDKHAAQWENTLTTYAFPVIGKLLVDSVDTGLAMKIIEPIWTTKTETASRVRGRIESILDWATVRGYRKGDNPARWHGHLESLLPARSAVANVEHHAALPYEETGAFIAELNNQEGVAARALEFTILTAARTNEAIGAKWSEIDMAEKVWTIPAERMKMKREHRVPLSARAVKLLLKLLATKQGEFVFPGMKEGKPLSNMAMLTVLNRMSRNDLTAHGFRSTFRDWAAERTNVPSQVAEMALAHAIGDKVEAAYRRGELFDKRRKLMDSWASYCGMVASVTTVIQINMKRA